MNIAIGIIFIIICIMLLAYFAYKIYAKIKIRIKYKNAIKNNTGNFTKDEKVFIARFEEWVKALNSKENNEDKKIMFWEIIMEFLKLFVPIEKMPAQVAFIAGLIIVVTFIFALISIMYLPIKMIFGR